MTLPGIALPQHTWVLIVTSLDTVQNTYLCHLHHFPVGGVGDRPGTWLPHGERTKGICPCFAAPQASSSSSRLSAFIS